MNTDIEELARNSFACRLRKKLQRLEERYLDLLTRSRIQNVDPNRRTSRVVYIGFAEWDWVPDDDLVAERTRLLADLDGWLALFRLLHRAALPETEGEIQTSVKLLRGWLTREGGDHSIPSTVDQARERLQEAFARLQSLVEMGTHGPTGLVVVPDTNALLRSPDIGAYHQAMGTDRFTIVFVTTVLAELDELKDRGRSAEVRDAARGVVRRIKGLRDRGDLHKGVRVAGGTLARAEHREVRVETVLDWLDPTVPDDKILGATLDLQARHPSATVLLLTGDVNLQNKAAAVGLPFVEPPGLNRTGNPGDSIS